MGYTFQWDVLWRYSNLIYSGALITLAVSLVTVVSSIALGVVIGLWRISSRKPLRIISSAYVGLIRNTPLLIQMFYIYFGLAQTGLIISPFLSIVIALTVHYASYAAEIIRANIQSLGKGQGEAALALGMTGRQALARIILPQAIRRSIPALGNQLIYLVKDSSLMAFFGMKDLMYAGVRIQVDTWRVFEGYIFIGVVYLALSSFLAFGLKTFERKVVM